MPLGRVILASLIVLAACRRAEPEHTASRVTPSIRDGGTEIPDRLVFGLAPFLPEAEMRKQYAPLVDYLGKQVGVPVEVWLADSYAELAGLLSSFKVHIAMMPPFAYVQAKRDNPGLILIATAIADGSSTYAAYIVTRDDSGVDTVEQLRGKRFAYVDRQSSSGYLYPLAYLRSADIDPDRFFREVVWAKDHGRLIDMVLAREVEAGATFSTAVKIKTAEHAEGKRLKILAKTGRIPLDAYCVNQRLDQGLVERVKKALLNLSTRDEAGRNILNELHAINGFVAVGDDHYDEVRRVARLLEQPAHP